MIKFLSHLLVLLVVCSQTVLAVPKPQDSQQATNSNEEEWIRGVLKIVGNTGMKVTNHPEGLVQENYTPSVPNTRNLMEGSGSEDDYVSHIAGVNGDEASVMETPTTRRVMPSEFEKIEGLILGRPDTNCSGTTLETARNSQDTVQYMIETENAHKKLIDSALKQNVTVFYTVGPTSVPGCREKLSKWLTEMNLEKGNPARKLLQIIQQPFEVETAPKGWNGPGIWTRDYNPIWVDRPPTSDNPTVITAVRTRYWGSFVDESRVVATSINNAVSNRTQNFTKSFFESRVFSLEGGNFMSDRNGLCISSKRFLLTNNVTEDVAKDMYAKSFGCQHSIYMEMLPFDQTKHIDMYVSFAKDKTILFGTYQKAQHDASAAVSAANLEKLKSYIQTNNLGYNVVEVPMPAPCRTDDQGCAAIEKACPLSDKNQKCTLTALSECAESSILDHVDCLSRKGTPSRTFVNMFHLNGDVHIPVSATASDEQTKALEIITRETGKRVVQHPVDTLALSGGAIHCITKQLPQGSLMGQ